MIIGKQSTLNDLGDLKKDLEAKIADAKNINVGAVSQIQTGDIVSGSVFDDRPTGVYRVHSTADRGAFSGTGTVFSMRHNTDERFANYLYVSWSGKAYVGVKNIGNTGDNFVTEILTKSSTITDSNGFIKAA